MTYIDLDLGTDLNHDRTLPDFEPSGRSILALHYHEVNSQLRPPDLFRLQQVKNRLVWQRGRELFDEMAQDDMVIKGTSSLVSSIVQDARWQPADDTKEAKFVSDKLTTMFKAMKGGFIQKLYAMVEGLRQGFSVTQDSYRIETEGECAGHLVIDDLEYLLPHFLYPSFDRKGKLQAILQYDALSQEQYVEIPISQLLHFVNKPHEDPFAGVSIYVPAFPHWQAKQILMMLRNNNFEMAAGKLVVKHVKPDGDRMPGMTEAVFQARAEKLIANYLRFFGFKLWSGMAVELMQSTTSPGAFDEVLTFCNQGILRSLGPPWMVIEPTMTGAYSMADVHREGYLDDLRPLRQQAEELFSDRNGPSYKICKANGWALRHQPRLVLSKETQTDQMPIINVILQSEAAPNLSVTDKNEIRKRVNWPLLAEAKADEASSESLNENLPALQTFAASKYSAIDFSPPEGVRAAAKRGLELRREFGRGGTDVGVARARDLSNGKNMSPDTILRMYSFFARHEVDKREGWGDASNPTNGYIAWMLWGGDPGKAWASKVRRQMESADGTQKFAAVQWWKRPLTDIEKRVNFEANDRGLDLIIEDAKDELEKAWNDALAAYRHKVEGWIKSSKVSPREMLRNIRFEPMDLDAFIDVLYQAGVKAWKFGGEQALKELRSAGIEKIKIPAAMKFAADPKASPANPFDLGNFKEIILGRSYEVARGFEQKALTAIANSLLTTYTVDAGSTDLQESVARIRDVFNGLQEIGAVRPGDTKQHINRPAVQETTVRTLTASAFGAARADLYKRNSDFVQGIMRSEVAEGKDYSQNGDLRSHEVSRYVDGITIRLSDPRSHYFMGPCHFNDRGVAVPVTKLDEDVEWSTDAEIDYAIQKGKELSPRFF